MKKTLIFIYLLCGYATSFAQETIDRVKHRFIYEAIYKNTVEGGKKKDIHNLDIGEHCSYFYSANRRREKEIIDSINHTGSVSIDLLRRATKDISGGRDLHIYKEVPKEGMLTFIGGRYELYTYEEPKAELNWKMEMRDTTILGYKCQAATAELRGRTWHVWYAEDIPISDGPWKLWGLPGLIMKAEESEGIYSFSCIGIENGNEEPISINKKNVIKSTPKEIQKLDIKYYRESIHGLGEEIAAQFIREYGGDGYETPILIEDYEKK